jgi:hypothetical protein
MRRCFRGGYELICGHGVPLAVAGVLALAPTSCAANRAETARATDGVSPEPAGPPASATATSASTAGDPHEEPAPSEPQCTPPTNAGSTGDAGSPTASAQTGSDSGIIGAKEAFGGGMTRPSVLCAPRLTFSKEALAHGVSGVALLKCIIELDGWLSHCTLIKSLPYMDDHLLAATTRMRYTPVMYRGHPQRVEMVIPIRVLPPPPAPAK